MTSATRRRGRPRGRFDASLDWETARSLFETGVPLAEIARRLNCSRQNVHRRAKQERWERRCSKGVESPDGRPGNESDVPRPHTPVEPRQVLDRFIRKFTEAMDSGRVRHDAVADFATAVRLRQSLVSEEEERRNTNGLPPLAELQRRHAHARAVDASIAAHPEVAGIVELADGPPRDGA